MRHSHLQAALRWARRGRILPLGDCDGDDPKVPRITGWTVLATQDQRTVRAWWRLYPKANIGLICDPWLCLDPDWYRMDTSSSNTTRALIRRLERELGPIPTQETPNGGEHLWLRGPGGKLPKKIRIGGQTIEGLDVLANPELQGVVYGRAHGTAWTWKQSGTPPCAPGWLLEALRSSPENAEGQAAARIPRPQPIRGPNNGLYASEYFAING
jgi:hypothetical protein